MKDIISEDIEVVGKFHFLGKTNFSDMMAHAMVHDRQMSHRKEVAQTPSNTVLLPSHLGNLQTSLHGQLDLSALLLSMAAVFGGWGNCQIFLPCLVSLISSLVGRRDWGSCN